MLISYKLITMKRLLVFSLGVFLLFTLTSARVSERIPNLRGGRDNKNWMSLCKCAESAVKQMQGVMREYAREVSKESVKKSNKNYKPPALNEVLNKVTKIANDCTKRSDCRCPEGYFKTNDGTHCLKISKHAVTCREAVNRCSQSMNSRLAVAKDSRKLTKLSDYIRDANPQDDSNYWIGLSYNRTDGGVPLWTWEDGTKASYSITKNLKNNVKKSLLTITGLDDENGEVLERVAISKDYEGKHYQQDSCVDGIDILKHKYICEFVMFKVHVKAQSSDKSRPMAGTKYE